MTSARSPIRRLGSALGRLLSMFVLIAAASAATWAWKTRPDPTESSGEKFHLLEVETSRIPLTPLPNTLEISGFFQPHRTVDLTLEESGRIVARPHEEGATLASGELVIGLETSMIQAQIAQARATVRQAQRDEELAAERLDRAERLAAQQAVSRDDLDAARSSQAVTEAVLEAQRAALRQLEVRRDRHTLRTPMPGVLTDLMIERGSHVTAGTPIGTLSDTATLELVIEVAPEVRTQLSGETSVLVWPDTDPADIRSGQVVRLAEVADPISRKFEVEIHIPNADGRLLGGAPAVARLTFGTPREALLLPEEWTTQRSGVRVVFAVVEEPEEPAHVEQVRVVTRPVRDWPGMVEVTSGLAAGTVLVTERLTEIEHGQVIDAEAVPFHPPGARI